MYVDEFAFLVLGRLYIYNYVCIIIYICVWKVIFANT